MSKIFKALERAETERRRDVVQTLRPSRLLDPEPEPDLPEELEEYERLKVMITLAASRAEFKSVMLVSAIPGEGVSTVALGLALKMAEGAQQGVLAIDCNSENPDLPGRLGLAPRWGLAELLAKEVSRAEAILSSGLPRLFVLGRGRPESDLAQPPSLALFDGLLNELRSAFDCLILDGGSLRNCPDSLLLASRVDGVVLVVQAERTPADTLRDASSELRRAGANLLGAVLNRRRNYLPRFLSRNA